MNKPKPKIIVLSGYGLNCEEETKFAFELAGGIADIVHINDLVSSKKKLASYQIMAVPGGFSYGDDIGSGRAYANKLNNHLSEKLRTFAEQDKLIAGICNGFQILTQSQLLPGALTNNKFPRYLDRWVDLKIRSTSPWLTGIKTLSLPIAHGEGNFYINNKGLKELKKHNQLAGVYYKGEMSRYQSLPENPNGSLEDIAMITSQNGRVLGTMPHPERAIFFTQTPNWPVIKEGLIRAGKKLPEFGPGLQIFKNAVNYFS